MVFFGYPSSRFDYLKGGVTESTLASRGFEKAAPLNKILKHSIDNFPVAPFMTLVLLGYFE